MEKSRIRKIQSIGLAIALVAVAFANHVVFTNAASATVTTDEGLKPVVELTFVGPKDSKNSKAVSPRMEIGDKVIVGVKVSGISTIDTLEASLNYDHDCFEQVKGDSVSLPPATTDKAGNVTDLSKQWGYGWDDSDDHLSIFNKDIAEKKLPSVLPVPSAEILYITFHVKKAVNDTTKISLSNIIMTTSLKEGPIRFEDGVDDQVRQIAAELELKNSKSGNRTVKISSPKEIDGGRKKEVVVPIKLDVNDGFNAMQINVTYEPSVFEYRRVEWSDKMRAQTQIRLDKVTEKNDRQTGEVILSMINGKKDATLSGEEFVFLTFKCLNTDRADGTISAKIETVSNISGTTITTGKGVYTDTVVKIMEVIRGDVNKDQQVNLIDAVMLLGWYNRGELEGLDPDRCDMDESGTINLLDVLAIMRHYNDTDED